MPDVGTLPGPVAEVVERADGTAIAQMFLIAAPHGLVALAALLFLPERPLGSRSGLDLAAVPDGTQPA